MGGAASMKDAINCVNVIKKETKTQAKEIESETESDKKPWALMTRAPQRLLRVLNPSCGFLVTGLCCGKQTFPTRGKSSGSSEATTGDSGRPASNTEEPLKW